MNKRALLAGLFYGITAIIFKLTVLLGGYTLTKFGFYYSNIVAIFLIVPFLFLGIYLVREKDLGGMIGTKEAMRAALTVVAIGAVILSIYNYVEFKLAYKDLSVEYYNSVTYFNLLKEEQSKHPDKLKVEDFPKIIRTQIESLSASRTVTARLFPLMIMGLMGSFFAALLMKKTAR